MRGKLRRQVGRWREALAAPWGAVASAVRKRAAPAPPVVKPEGGPDGRGEGLRPGGPPADEPARVRWVEEVEAARREWLGYRAYFDCVSEPELVDHAIYAVQAAERKYMYLLRRARMAGVDLTEPVGPYGLLDEGAPRPAARAPSAAPGEPAVRR